MGFFVYRNIAEINSLTHEEATEMFFAAYPCRRFADAVARQRPFRMFGDLEQAVEDNLKKIDLLNSPDESIFKASDPPSDRFGLNQASDRTKHRTGSRNTPAVLPELGPTLGRILSNLLER